MAGRRPILLTVLALVALSWALYVNALRGSFQFDDATSILENDALLSGNPVTWWEYWPSRFVPYATLAVDRHLHGLATTGYHVTNVMIHALATLAVAWLVLELARLVAPRRDARFLALVAAAIFAAHPLQTQAVAYITQRMASLYTLFYVVTVAAYLRGLARETEGRGRGWTLVVGLGSGVLAMLSKEPAITLPLAIVLADVVAASRTRGRWRRLLPYLPIALVIPIVVWMGGARFGVDDATIAAQTTHVSRGTYFLTQLDVLARYLRLLVLPLGQNVDPDVPWRTSWFVPAVMGATALHATLVGLAVYGWRRGERLFSFAVAWWYLTLLPESSVFPITDPMAEHRLYAAMPGFALVAALPIESLARRRRRTATVVFVVVVSTLGALTVSRNQVWQNPYALWRDALEKSPQKGRPHAALGWLHLRAGRYEQARERLQRAVTLDPGDPQVWNNLGHSQWALGDPASAVDSYEQALRLRPEEATLWLNLARAQQELGRIDDARRSLRTCLTIDPGNVTARQLLESVGDPEHGERSD